jgi:hypothetical protein
VDHQNFSAPASALVNPEIERARAAHEKAAAQRQADADARAAGANAAGSQSISRTMSSVPVLEVPVDIAVKVARLFLASANTIDIHDHHAVVASHAAIRECLRSLLAALDAEDGGQS